MSKFTVFLTILLSSIFALASCSLLPGKTNTPGLVMEQTKVFQGGYESKPALAVINGQPAALFVDADQRLIFRTAKIETIIGASLKVKGQQFLGLSEHKGEIYAYWWTHDQGKKIYLAKSIDGGKKFGEPIIVTPSDSAPLAPLQLLTPDGAKPVFMLYQDERNNQYHIYINRYDPSTKSWPKQDQRLDEGKLGENASGVPATATFPVVIQHDNSFAVAWMTNVMQADGMHYRVLARISQDGGKEWGPEELVADSKTPITNLAGALVNKLFAFAFDIGSKGIVVATKQDQQPTWNVSAPLQDSSLNTNSGMVAAGGKGPSEGKLFLTWIAQKPISKPNIQAATYDVKISAWIAGQQRIDTKKFDQTQSVMPSIAVNDQGIPLISWVDYRNIIPNIYISGSFDGGKKWTAPQNTEENGMETGIITSLYEFGDKYLLGYQNFTDSTHVTRNFILREITPQPENSSFGPLPKSKEYSEQDRQKLLENRVKDFWNTRMDGKFQQSWDYYDPAYKAAVPQDQFVKMQGDFKYFDYKVISVKISGNIANVVVKTNFEIPGSMIMGHKIEQQKRQAKTEATWVWIGDNWFQVFVNPVAGAYLQY
jgi:hypothetical protein